MEQSVSATAMATRLRCRSTRQSRLYCARPKYRLHDRTKRLHDLRSPCFRIGRERTILMLMSTSSGRNGPMSSRMRVEDRSMSSSYVPAFEVRNARRNTIPVLATIPHRGTHVPPDIAARMVPKHARWLCNTDWFLAELYAFLPEMGITTIMATHSRYVEDVNRDPGQAPWANR
ncbi:N-formylglutamate amidohydrolase [Burkholderia aenigmatica]|uniref:N-formylglutamate amidohydrolase n=2 Tax=Burkholderia cepacia complex TaxID=87882 RepID=UPI000F078F71|nr:N-formylglutamate amidohydrolase [Burkholderia aenigmatica]AYQ43726.1 hypothetical protein CVS37_37645 [Burkholderia lata]